MTMSSIYDKQFVILMTACVRPDGMIYTSLQDPWIRASQYVEAIDFYLRETDYNIVFCENSGVDLWNEISASQKETRLEYLTFNGNNYDKKYGKGYGEAKIIQHAFQHSIFLKEASYVIKITGRVKVLNIDELAKGFSKAQLSKDIIGVDFSSDMGRISSVCFWTSKSWIQQAMEKYAEVIRDDGVLNFEGALYKAIVESPNLKILRVNLKLKGVSAGFNVPYRNHNDNDHKCDHYHILCSIYKARKDLWNLFLSLIPFGYYEFLRLTRDFFSSKKKTK